MDSLPSEIVNEILLLVDRPSLYYVAEVCNLWRQLALKHVVIIKSTDSFNTACCQGDRLSIIKSQKDRWWLEDGLKYACLGGHKELVELMISRGAKDWDHGLFGACQDGHKELVELMISRGAKNWNDGLYRACQFGHKELAELMMGQGANDWNNGLYDACQGGSKELIELMIAQGANEWNYCLYEACNRDCQEVVDLLISIGATSCRCGKSITEHQ